jgi:hypothetical protein
MFVGLFFLKYYRQFKFHNNHAPGYKPHGYCCGRSKLL